MTEPLLEREHRAGRRLLGLGVAGLASGAAALWGSSRLVWAWADLPAAPPGPAGSVPLEITGASVVPALTAVALLALAAIAAGVALSGIARRIVGLLVAASGLWAGWASLAAWLGPPAAGELPAAAGRSPVGVELADVVVLPSAAPWLGVFGGMLTAIAAGVFAAADRRLPRLGARYSAPGQARSTGEPAEPHGSGPRGPDAGRTAWNELDSGVDPTVDGALAPAPDRTTQPGPEPEGPGGREPESDV